MEKEKGIAMKKIIAEYLELKYALILEEDIKTNKEAKKIHKRIIKEYYNLI